MAVSSNGYTLSTSAYTAVATSSVGRVRIVTDNNRLPVRMVVAPSLPSADTDDWFPLQAGSTMSLEGLGGFTVWAKADEHPSGATFTQKVRVLIDEPIGEVMLRQIF